MTVGYAGLTGDEGFERLQAILTEDTSEAVESAWSWLLTSQPLAEVRLRDQWHGRCLGAAVSAGVVPAVAAGRPVWRVDNRLLWLDGDRLLGADENAWPRWAADISGGGVSSPAPRSQLAEFVNSVAGWGAPTLEDAVATLVRLGWATTDPDTVSWPQDHLHAQVRLGRPAGCTFMATTLDNRIRSWTIELAASKDPTVVAPLEQTMRELLAPHADPERGGWYLGSFRIEIPGGVFWGGGRSVRLSGFR